MLGTPGPVLRRFVYVVVCVFAGRSNLTFVLRVIAVERSQLQLLAQGLRIHSLYKGEVSLSHLPSACKYIMFPLTTLGIPSSLARCSCLL